MRKVVVIGGSAAGMMAAIAAAQQDQDAQVSVVTKDPVPYRRPAIPALIAGYISGPEGAKVFTDQVLARYNIRQICPAEVVDIDPATKNVSIVTSSKEQKLAYGAVVIATGGHPLVPNIPGAHKKGVCTFTTYEAAAEIVEIASTASCAVVVGAGFIALEIAEALMHRGLDVYFNVRSRILRRLLEPDVSEFLSQKFERQGLKMLTGEAISQIGGASSVEHVVYKGKKIDTNLVVMGTGVKPNVALAEKCGIELAPTGAIKVDSSLQTSVEDIYAVGDCAESPDLGTGRFVYSPVGSIGAAAGRIAGKNAAGANLKVPGFLRAQADQILGLQIFSLGHSTTTAREVNLDVSVHDLPAPESFAGKKDSFQVAKILTDRNDKIVGAQLVAQKYGSQFAYQLYNAVLGAQKKDQFLERFSSPRMRMAEALVYTMDSAVDVETFGEDHALKFAKLADNEKTVS